MSPVDHDAPSGPTYAREYLWYFPLPERGCTALRAEGKNQTREVNDENSTAGESSY